MVKKSFKRHGETIEYYIVYKNIKSIRMKLDDDNNIIISASRFVASSVIENFIYKNKSYVEEKIEQKNKLTSFYTIKNYETGEFFYLFDNKTEIISNVSNKNKVFLQGNTLYILSKSDDIVLRKNQFESFIKAYVKPILYDRVCYFHKYFENKIENPPKLTVRFMKTRWGTCKPKDEKITLNAKLAFLDAGFINRVVVHELCHFYHLDHSKQFYDLLTKFYPNYKKEMKKYNSIYSNIN